MISNNYFIKKHNQSQKKGKLRRVSSSGAKDKLITENSRAPATTTHAESWQDKEDSVSVSLCVFGPLSVLQCVSGSTHTHTETESYSSEENARRLFSSFLKHLEHDLLGVFENPSRNHIRATKYSLVACQD